MNKKFWILGVITMILMASMAFVGCDNGTTDPYSGKVVAEQYRGTFIRSSNSNIITINENTFVSAGTGNSYPVYTEGNILYVVWNDVEEMGVFTDIDTFHYTWGNGVDVTYNRQK